MSRRSAILMACGFVAMIAAPAGAQIAIGDWIGVYEMNHDGHPGTLHIDDSKADCATPAWCALRLSYVDANNTRIPAEVRLVDQDGQHMAFDVLLPGNRQRFHGYLMSSDKTRMAGTTVWNRRTFGFYAVKRPPSPVAPITRLETRPARGRGAAVLTPAPRAPVAMPVTPPVPSPFAPPPAAAGGRTRILPDGQVETTLPDGSRRLQRPGQCGWTTIFPNGTAQTMACSTQVQPVSPPVPDAASAAWLDRHNDALLNVVRGLLDPASVENYLRASESATPGVYERIQLRTSLIALLTSGS